MKIQVWSDFRCPFCYIGKRNLENAVKKSNKDIEIELMSYELNPNFEPIEGEGTYVQKLSKTLGISETKAQASTDHIQTMATQAGLNYDFESIIDVNSFKTHRVFQMAKNLGKGNEFFEKGMSAHFIEGLDISDEKVLVELAISVGIDETKVTEALTSDDIAYQVRNDQQHAQNIGVQGVPHFLIDNKVFVSGAQPVDAFLEAIEYVESLDK